ncbi:helix-turn-helix domain-containing protein [Lacrimispora sp.]|uniref:helix-turn-helix domain-containing protein n=1 Tax=Lacrimispora sp. TaxID=2719234 RepID=UPI0028A0B7E4|nr:helix-turn-helix transcriptional regulator [Lacrimispora sp.]
MNSVDLIKKICKERKIPISHLERDLGYGNGYISQLRKGTVPSDRAVEIANYLNIDLQYLLSGGQDLSTDENSLTTRDRRDIAKDLESIMNKLSSGEEGPASYDGEELDSDAAELFRDELEIALRRLKIINKEKYTSKKNKK